MDIGVLRVHSLTQVPPDTDHTWPGEKRGEKEKKLERRTDKANKLYPSPRSCRLHREYSRHEDVFPFQQIPFQAHMGQI